jgi:hypothetical protein
LQSSETGRLNATRGLPPGTPGWLRELRIWADRITGTGMLEIAPQKFGASDAAISELLFVLDRLFKKDERQAHLEAARKKAH